MRRHRVGCDSSLAHPVLVGELLANADLDSLILGFPIVESSTHKARLLSYIPTLSHTLSDQWFMIGRTMVYPDCLHLVSPHGWLNQGSSSMWTLDDTIHLVIQRCRMNTQQLRTGSCDVPPGPGSDQR